MYKSEINNCNYVLIYALVDCIHIPTIQITVTIILFVLVETIIWLLHWHIDNRFYNNNKNNNKMYIYI